MKWIEVSKARKLEIDKPVFVMYGENFGYGRLIKEEKTKDGVVRTFELATFEGVKPVLQITSVTHIAIP